jgi:hypothetical protein
LPELGNTLKPKSAPWESERSLNVVLQAWPLFMKGIYDAILARTHRAVTGALGSDGGVSSLLAEVQVQAGTPQAGVAAMKGAHAATDSAIKQFRQAQSART